MGVAVRAFLLMLLVAFRLTAAGELAVELTDQSGSSVEADVYIVRHTPGSERLVRVLASGRLVAGESRAFRFSGGGCEVVAVARDPWVLPVRKSVHLRDDEHRRVKLSLDCSGATGWSIGPTNIDSDAAWSELSSGSWIESEHERKSWVGPIRVDADRDRIEEARQWAAPEEEWRARFPENGYGSRLDPYRPIFRLWDRDPAARVAGADGPSSEVPRRGFSFLTAPRTDSALGGAVLTNGPLVELWINGSPAGGRTVPADGVAHCRLRVRAPGWMQIDTVELLVDGDPVRIFHPEPAGGVRLNTRERIDITEDCWISAVAYGREPLPKPAVAQVASERAFALTLPVIIDADNDGEWTSHAAWASELLDAAGSADTIGAAWGRAVPARRIALVDASIGTAWESMLLQAGLTDPAPSVRMGAIRAAGSGSQTAERNEMVRFSAAMSDDPSVRNAASNAGARTDENGTREGVGG